MIDFHTHLLPNIDDGASCAEESRLMLDALSFQGVKKAVLTPHFYPLADTVKNFLSRRKTAVENLLGVYDENNHPQLYLGAEVAYYHGIGKAETLQDMRICGTDLFLLELPYCKWDEGVVDDVFEFAENTRNKVIIAHINRYLTFKNAKYLDAMLKNGIMLQANAEWFIDKKTFKQGLKYVKNGSITFFGSDAHNALTRPPRLKEAMDKITEKLGEKAILQTFATGDVLLETAKKI